MRTDTRKYYPNKRPGLCERCGQTVAAHEGRVRRDRHFNWYVSHWPAREVGWPNVRWEGGCPPKSDPAEDEPAMTPEQARTILYQRLLNPDHPAPRYRDPGTDQGRERLDADCLRLAAMRPLDLAHDPEALATLLEIAEHQHWDG